LFSINLPVRMCVDRRTVFLHLVIPNSVNEARVFGSPFTPGVPSARGFCLLGWTSAFGVNGQSARVGVRDLVLFFEESTVFVKPL
jgi:hypothetical protein